ncbi:MAG: non-homologous end-joining DNA ligase [Flavobacteriales bacterium]|nr:non-homologous end-joining DNA ligase [Flavobacteriales bacterium]
MDQHILSHEQRERAEKKNQPDWMEPMLAKLTKDYFSDPDWIFERKLDGARCLVFKKGESVKLLSRNKKNQNHIYPELVEALRKQEYDFIADGEIVTFDGKTTSFSKLQARINVQKPSKDLIESRPVWLYIFDCMYVEGYDISALSNRERKKILSKTLHFQKPIRYCAHINENGTSYREKACEKGWEGVIAKDATKPYQHKRSGNWLKFKCVNKQELVIGGFTPPKGSREGFGALLVGFYEGDKLHYAGKVGTGYSDEDLRNLREKFDEKEIDETPFYRDIEEKDAHWLKPEWVAEIGFTEWTGDNKLRHPRYLGLRKDKQAKEVVKETP